MQIIKADYGRLRINVICQGMAVNLKTREPGTKATVRL